MSSVRACVRASVTLKKGPKGLQNHQSSIRFIDKSEKVKFYSVSKLRALAKCPFKLGFGITFGIANAKNGFHLDRENLGSDGVKMVHFPLLKIFFHETLPFLL